MMFLRFIGDIISHLSANKVLLLQSSNAFNYLFIAKTMKIPNSTQHK